ncbi:MAG: 23S rRNA (pseudouridine(1915)-N(3))-methyltransferase RlmH [Victivallales bacterium]|nr:23S rRNA (pseudouridine(1915)-N(3))-methyltransferase RlmH [Victivallales bacterium]
MVIQLLVVGKLKDRALQARCDEYLKWLTAYGKVTLDLVPDSDPEHEGTTMLKRLEKERNARIIALTEEGTQYSSPELARHLGAFQTKIIFLIGGPMGLSHAVKQRADELWSLSRLTFTHEMARVLVLEQLFRANNILHGGHYQK